MSIDHDYSDKYYLGEKNRNRHLDFKLKKASDIVKASSLKDESQLEEVDSAADSLRKKALIGTDDKSLLNELAENKRVYEKQVLTSQKRRESGESDQFNTALAEFVAKTDLPSLYERLKTNPEEIPLSEVCLFGELLLQQGSGTKYDAPYDQHYDMSVLRSAILSRVRTGNEETVQEVIQVLTWDSRITDEIYSFLLPALKHPLPMVKNHLMIARGCVVYKEYKFVLDGLNGLKKLNDNNLYLKKVCLTLEEEPNVIDTSVIEELHKLVKANIEAYAPHLNQINDDTLDHDHVVDIFSTIEIAKKLGVDLSDILPNARELFLVCLAKLYKTNYTRYLEHSSTLGSFCDALELPRSKVLDLFKQNKPEQQTQGQSDHNFSYLDDL